MASGTNKQSAAQQVINTTDSDPDLRGLSPEEVAEKQRQEIAQRLGHEPMRHELPPDLRQAEEPYVRAGSKVLFTEEDAIRFGLTDAEVVRLRQTGAMANNGGLFEYDEEAELERLSKIRAQMARAGAVDGGDLYAIQISAMERYFKGLEKNAKTGKFCERQVTTLAEPRIVGINGYIFNIPAFRPVPLPTEVLDILEQSALALNQHGVYSAIMQARSSRKITLEDFMSSPTPESHLARFQASHSVRMGGDLAPYPGVVGTLDRMQAMANPRGM